MSSIDLREHNLQMHDAFVRRAHESLGKMLTDPSITEVVVRITRPRNSKKLSEPKVRIET